eukprot:1194981-Prorocentrum_minimum.AAC.2
MIQSSWTNLVVGEKMPSQDAFRVILQRRLCSGLKGSDELNSALTCCHQCAYSVDSFSCVVNVEALMRLHLTIIPLPLAPFQSVAADKGAEYECLKVEVRLVNWPGEEAWECKHTVMVKRLLLDACSRKPKYAKGMDGKRIYELMQEEEGGISHQSFDLLDPGFSKDLLGPSSGPSCEEIKQRSSGPPCPNRVRTIVLQSFRAIGIVSDVILCSTSEGGDSRALLQQALRFVTISTHLIGRRRADLGRKKAVQKSSRSHPEVIQKSSRSPFS